MTVETTAEAERPPLSAAPPPAVGWASGPLGAVQAADREVARQTALRARAVAAFAATRPSSVDRPQGEPGAMSAERWAARSEVLRAVSEWAAPELAIALNLSTPKAEAELERSLTLVHRLPEALAALEAGVLHVGHLWCLLEHVAPISDAALRARILDELIAWVHTRHRVTTPAQLGDRVRRVVARHNARDAAQDLARALRQRGISLRPERTAGMAALTVVCTMPEAQALHRALGACADALDAEPGDERTRGQKMVDCLLDLVLRPGEGDLPPVQVLLTVVASVATLLGGDAPGEVDGHVVPAEMVRHLLRGLTGHDLAAVDEQPPAAATPRPAAAAADDRPWEEVEQAELARWWAEMERRVLADELDDEPEPPRMPGPSPTRAAPTAPTPTHPRIGPTPARATSAAPTPIPTQRRWPIPIHWPTAPSRHRPAAGGRTRTGRSMTRPRRCTPPRSRSATPGGCCAPPKRPTPPTRPPGTPARPAGSPPRPTAWPHSPPRATPSVRSWPRCWPPPPAEGWPTGPAWP
ncbi:DUF222 domain-containing protein [Geodermatophilus sp. SYSU D00965]